MDRNAAQSFSYKIRNGKSPTDTFGVAWRLKFEENADSTVSNICFRIFFFSFFFFTELCLFVIQWINLLNKENPLFLVIKYLFFKIKEFAPFVYFITVRELICHLYIRKLQIKLEERSNYTCYIIYYLIESIFDKSLTGKDRSMQIIREHGWLNIFLKNSLIHDSVIFFRNTFRNGYYLFLLYLIFSENYFIGEFQSCAPSNSPELQKNHRTRLT